MHTVDIKLLFLIYLQEMINYDKVKSLIDRFDPDAPAAAAKAAMMMQQGEGVIGLPSMKVPAAWQMLSIRRNDAGPTYHKSYCPALLGIPRQRTLLTPQDLRTPLTLALQVRTCSGK